MGHDFSVCLYIQSAVEVDFAAGSTNPNIGSLPARKPNIHMDLNRHLI